MSNTDTDQSGGGANDPSQGVTERRETKLSLGHLTGIPAHVIGLFWVCCSFSGLYDAYPYLRYDNSFRVAKGLLQWLNVLAAFLLVVLQVLSVYKVAILASNDRWQRTVRVRVPFIWGLMIVLDVLLIGSLIFCTVVVLSWTTPSYWEYNRIITGSVAATFAAMQYSMILIGMLSRGRISLCLKFERTITQSNVVTEQTPAPEPYRDVEGEP